MRCTTNRCRPNILLDLNRGMNQLMQGVLAQDVTGSDDPRLSLVELDNRYVVECDLPGVSVEAVSLQVEDNVLTISGNRAVATADDNVRILFNERPVSEFARRIQLAHDVDASAVDAELSNGVLRITIPKRAELQPRKIEIRRATGGN